MDCDDVDVSGSLQRNSMQHEKELLQLLLKITESLIGGCWTFLSYSQAY